MTRTEAIHLRGIVEQAAQSLNDAVALQAIFLHPHWTAGVDYTAGYKTKRGGKLWRCLQAHTSQEGWEPENAPALWEGINETHDGTLYNPVPYDGNMTLVAGLYYAQDGKVYLCSRDTGNPVYHALRDLVGLYVEPLA